MTQAQVQRHLDGVKLRTQYEHAARMSLAWHTAAMAPERMRRLPSLERLVRGERTPAERPGQTPEQMREKMKGIVRAFGGTFEKHTGPMPEIRRLPT